VKKTNSGAECMPRDEDECVERMFSMYQRIFRLELENTELRELLTGAYSEPFEHWRD